MTGFAYPYGLFDDDTRLAVEEAGYRLACSTRSGFNGTDANILSSFAEQLLKGRTLSAKQLAIAFKKLPKYSRQVIGFIPADKLAQMETNLTA